MERTARLARLSLSADEKDKMRAELEAMLQMADTLAELDTEGVPAAALIGGGQNVFRPDEIHSAFTRDEMLREAPLGGGRLHHRAENSTARRTVKWKI